MNRKLNSPFAKPLTDGDIKAAKRLKTIWVDKKQDLMLTQEKVAEKLDISQAAVSKYLNGRIALNVQATLAWAAILKVPPEEIRPDRKKYFSSTIQKKKLPLLAELTSSGSVRQFNKFVTVSMPIDGDFKTVSIKTTIIPGYFNGQIVLFDEGKEPNKSRHAVAEYNGDYFIAKYDNEKWLNVLDNTIIPETASIHPIVGSFFED